MGRVDVVELDEEHLLAVDEELTRPAVARLSRSAGGPTMEASRDRSPIAVLLLVMGL